MRTRYDDLTLALEPHAIGWAVEGAMGSLDSVDALDGLDDERDDDD